VEETTQDNERNMYRYKGEDGCRDYCKSWYFSIFENNQQQTLR